MADAIGVAVEDYRSAWRAIDERIEQGAWAPASSDRWRDLYGPLVRALDLPLSPDQVASRFGELFRSTHAYAVYPDVAPALRRLVDAGFRLGVLSNSDFPLEPILEHCAIDQFIDSAVPAVAHGTTKPHPEAFLLCTNALGVSPETCWFVGDRLIDDVMASAELGMSSVLVDRAGRYAPVEVAFPRITDLSELAAVIGDC